MPTTRRTILLYYLYQATLSNGFYLPVGIIFLQQQRGFGLGIIGLTQGAFGLALVFAEIPTGYLGDRLGRRSTLALSSVITTLVMALYTVITTPTAYVLLYILWAIGWSLESGTGSAWLYEILSERLDSDEFARVRGRGSTVSLLVSAISAVIAGVLVTVAWPLPFVAAATLSAAGLPVLVALPTATVDTRRLTLVDGLRTLSTTVTDPGLRWFIVYSAIFYALFDVLRAFEQPAVTGVGVPVAALGVLYAGLKLVSACSAAATGWFANRFGVSNSFRLLIPVVGIAFLLVGILPVVVIPVVFLIRAIQSIVQPLRAQYVNDRADDVGRATVLSGVSMALSLAGGGANLVAGQFAERVGLIVFLAVAGCLSVGAAGLLWIRTTPVRNEFVR
ncbi:MFS transporter [Haladaptatus cibarius]|uniref:MFS transporter n=1 Tax=Haladaptatus cibarius TaxID=453847 RepID=UPI000678C660|nr:MFS transporter [Haladaptatus cibarius]